ncbi:hypothetical protein M2101_001567, partial [Parabacteroides sp. PM5-20]|nr:hypothetical protein [Parabacteroides sp. PM5-20]
SSWIRRGGPLLAVVEQFEFFINAYTYFRVTIYTCFLLLLLEIFV